MCIDQVRLCCCLQAALQLSLEQRLALQRLRDAQRQRAMAAQQRCKQLAALLEEQPPDGVSPCAWVQVYL